MIYLAADHRGFQLKETLKRVLLNQDLPVQDMGAFTFDESDDYVDFARAALEKIIDNPGLHKGIFICGSGHGMNMVADKYKGIRAAMGFNRYVAVQSRQHENANVLILAADWVKEKEAEDIVSDWLNAEFTTEQRHARRLKKISEIEDKNFMYVY
ncbi:MAG: RpiB/LacA/LacB family sugar-phosphate isomerase [Candidatus Sungbacteria bacterium]|nr:RpiB/LacA/LacB family sugar-phosphate isomerase [bacterium]MDZ4260560.1 RpiB/LacA/LacB family sugar-phosphate isomerase [Candidatus Sungbacteria bacterium]